MYLKAVESYRIAQIESRPVTEAGASEADAVGNQATCQTTKVTCLRAESPPLTDYDDARSPLQRDAACIGWSGRITSQLRVSSQAAVLRERVVLIQCVLIPDIMADKEVTVYIVDLGPTMGETRHGRNETDLDWSLRWVWDKISTTVSAGRKTWNVGVLGLRTRETRNPTYDEQREGYEGISVLLDIGPVTMASIRELQALLRVNEGDSVDGDAISAVVVACDMIINFAKHLKYRKQIFLVTDGRGLMDDSEEDFPEIGQKLKDHDIRFTVLYEPSRLRHWSWNALVLTYN